MKFYKDKDTALDEIQSKSKQNQLGIPVDDLRGTLNNISKETNLQNSSFGIPTEQQRPSNVYLDESRVSFIEDEEEKPIENIETTNDNQNVSVQKTNDQPSSKDLKTYSDESSESISSDTSKASYDISISSSISSSSISTSSSHSCTSPDS